MIDEKRLAEIEAGHLPGSTCTCFVVPELIAEVRRLQRVNEILLASMKELQQELRDANA